MAVVARSGAEADVLSILLHTKMTSRSILKAKYISHGGGSWMVRSESRGDKVETGFNNQLSGLVDWERFFTAEFLSYDYCNPHPFIRYTIRLSYSRLPSPVCSHS